MQNSQSHLRTLQKRNVSPIRSLLVLPFTVFWLSLPGCGPPVQSEQAAGGLPQMRSVPEPSAEKGFFVHAVVRRIDYRTGLVDIETEIGSFYAVADRDGLANLQKGDEITVYIVDDNAPVVRI